jgi:hypothetical protein
MLLRRGAPPATSACVATPAQTIRADELVFAIEPRKP